MMSFSRPVADLPNQQENACKVILLGGGQPVPQPFTHFDFRESFAKPYPLALNLGPGRRQKQLKCSVAPMPLQWVEPDSGKVGVVDTLATYAKGRLAMNGLKLRVVPRISSTANNVTQGVLPSPRDRKESGWRRGKGIGVVTQPGGWGPLEAWVSRS